MSVDLFVAGAAFQFTTSLATKAGCGHAALAFAMTALRRSSSAMQRQLRVVLGPRLNRLNPASC
jgi:hypothetical protein